MPHTADRQTPRPAGSKLPVIQPMPAHDVRRMAWSNAMRQVALDLRNHPAAKQARAAKRKEDEEIQAAVQMFVDEPRMISSLCV